MATTRLVVFPSIIFESYKRKAQSYPWKLYPKAARITILQALETFETSAGMYMQKDEMNESALKKKFRVVASSAGMLQFLLLTLAIYFALDQLYKYLLADSALMSNYVAFLANSASSLLSLVGLEHEVGIFEARSYRSFRVPSGQHLCLCAGIGPCVAGIVAVRGEVLAVCT